MSGLGSLLLVIGFSFYAYGSTKHRLPNAPIPFNGSRGWPWQHRDWFTRKGRVYRNVGLVFQFAGFALAVLSLLRTG